MKLHLANDSKQGLGGGWTFRRNLEKGLQDKAEVVDTIEESDIVLIAGATMINRDTAVKAKELGKKIILRVDGVPRNSRNRNTGTSRLYDFAQLSDAVIYQSDWSRQYLQPFLEKDGPVIINGCDTDIFTTEGAKEHYNGSPVYLYSRYNRDETKHWEEAWFRYQNVQRQNPSAKLVIVGNFSDEQVNYNFDFFMGENIQYEGIVSDQEKMARIYRGCNYFMMTYYNDACSNTLIEAICCGLSPVMVNLSGGTPEILQHDPSYFTLERMANAYMEVFNNV